VSDITGVLPPITSAGQYRLTAQVSGAPAGALVQRRWLRDDNSYDSVPPLQVKAWNTATYYDMHVQSGDYTIRVRAEVRSIHGTDTTYGAARIADFPVCTSVGSKALRPQADGGCGGDGDPEL
jgi:hypothetical protein